MARPWRSGKIRSRPPGPEPQHGLGKLSCRPWLRSDLKQPSCCKLLVSRHTCARTRIYIYIYIHAHVYGDHPQLQYRLWFRLYCASIYKLPSFWEQYVQPATACTRTYMYVHVHTYIHTYLHTYMHTRTHTHTRARTHANMRVCFHIYVYARMYVYIL